MIGRENHARVLTESRLGEEVGGAPNSLVLHARCLSQGVGHGRALGGRDGGGCASVTVRSVAAVALDMSRVSSRLSSRLSSRVASMGRVGRVASMGRVGCVGRVASVRRVTLREGSVLVHVVLVCVGQRVRVGVAVVVMGTASSSATDGEADLIGRVTAAPCRRRGVRGDLGRMQRGGSS